MADNTVPWALTNALLIDGTGAPAVPGATVGRASSDDYAAPRADALRYGVTIQRTLGDYLHDSIAVRDEIDAGGVR